EEQTTPFLARMAREGLVLENNSAASPWTLPSHISLFTALHPRAHGVRGGARMLPRDPEPTETLTRRFRDAGYLTYGVYSAPFLHPAYGFHDGFVEYHAAEKYLEEGSNIDAITDPALRRMMEVHGLADATYGNAPRVNEMAEEFLEGAARGDRPFFLFLHYWDVHYNYLPPEDYARRFLPDFGPEDKQLGIDFTPAHGDEEQREYSARELARIQALYDAEIRYVDDHLARIYAKIDELGIADDVILAVVSDHGDHFGESHEGKVELFHHRTLYQEVMHVPALVLAPGRLEAGTRVAASTSLYDVGPTLLDLAGLPVWPGRSGQSVVPLIGQSGALGHEVHMDLRHPGVPADLQGFRQGSLKVIRDHGWPAGGGQPGLPASTRFFDLAQDPHEQAPKSLEAVGSAGAVALSAMKALGPAKPAPLMEELPDNVAAGLQNTGYVDSFDSDAGTSQSGSGGGD
ncbi:MAG: sulfatase, partial [Planctomycetes bacterium]|nr:sulfatase [Planctomycetota bacterium]